MRKRQSLSGRMAATGLMLFFLAALVLGAMRLPQVYGSYSDRRTLNRPEYTENDVKIYVYDYASMEEKLQDIAYYESRSIEWQNVLIPAAGDTKASDDELNGYLQQELDQLYGLGILRARVDLSAFRQARRELRNIYPSNGDRLKGQISYWQLYYESEEGLLITQMDTEYHKLYSINLDGVNAQRNCSAVGEYLADRILRGHTSGAEAVQDLMGSLSEGYAKYYGIAVSAEAEDLDVYKEKMAGEWAGPAETAALMASKGDEGWGFGVESAIAVKGDGSGLGVWGSYYTGDASFSSGILWGN
ncbi:MAG: hypothetical protein HFI88_11790 [Lachnospiraceae bacterium]|nr:hypothetical protein [Lachnospiraceae bacterium]